MQQANPHSLASSSSKVILLVEDHASYREVVRAALGKYLPGCQMVAAESVAAAMAVLESHQIDVLVADMTLPDGSAIDLIEQAGSFIQQGVKVIVFSSHAIDDMLPVLSRPDVHGYVSKEHGLKELARAILAISAGEMNARSSLVEQVPAVREQSLRMI